MAQTTTNTKPIEGGAPSNLSDAQILTLCKRYGKQALEARAKFIGLLPEVHRRRLYEPKFKSIFHFAKIMAGLSEKQVRRVINVDKNLEDRPHLRPALREGEISINKIARVVSIATPENDKYLAVQTKKLSQKAVETLVRDIKTESQQQAESSLKSVRTHTLFEQSIQLDPDVEQELHDLQNKGININDLLREMLQKRREELAEEKQKLSQEELAKYCKTQRTLESESRKPSRYIPVKIKRHLKREHGTKCSLPTCAKPSMHIHHTQRFSLSQNHDPRYLAPLCKEHHQIAHTIDQKYQQKMRC